MSQNYKFKTLSLVKEERQEDQKDNPNGLKVYEIGETRTIDFIQKDGTRQCFPYSHMLTAWYGKENNDRIIKIFFATHTVTIYGYNLGYIYEEINKQKIQTIVANDLRYNDMESKNNNSYVIGILVKWKEKPNLTDDFKNEIIS